MTIIATEIPLSPQAQRFTVSLAGVTRTLTLRWCAPLSTWVLDIADVDGVPLVSGVPLITGADLLEQYGYLGLGGKLFVQSDDNVDATPTFKNLGSISHLYFVTIT